MHRRFHAVMLATTALMPVGAWLADANPLDPRVVGGHVTFNGLGTQTLTINQSTLDAIIDWNSFNIGVGERTIFILPTSNSISLDRVSGVNPSYIMGSLSSNGIVFLVNPNGVLFGAGATINAASFLATTHNISNSDFLAHHFNFNQPGNPSASIVNLGHITAASGGFAALVAPGVRNAGTISATLGTVGLAASGKGFTLDFYGDKLITLAVNDSIGSKVIDVATGQPLTSLVSNSGKIQANGGRVEITAAAARTVVDSVINNSGVIEANSIGNKNGTIVLSAATGASKPAGAPAQNVVIGGRISASGKRKGETGGTIQVTGENISLTGAKIDASGNAGGGTVLIGGDIGGGKGNPAVPWAHLQPWLVPNATTVSIDGATVINASATGSGNGGKVVVWSDSHTNFAGQIYATGGPNGGNGGFTEVSSHGVLDFAGLVNLSASAGKPGTLLLDPTDLYITNGSVPDGASKMTPAQVETILGTENLVLTAGGNEPNNINIQNSVMWMSGNSLTLDALHNVAINASISALNGGLIINAGNVITATAAVNVNAFTLQSGAWTQIASVLPDFSANDFRITGGSFLRALGGNGTIGSPYQITDVYGLQGIGSSPTLLASDYVLANNINATGTANWNGGQGFVPIGTNNGNFTGMLNGEGFTISGLTIAPTNLVNIGLFATIDTGGVVSNLTLSGANVTASPNISAQLMGILAGINLGTIQNVTVSGGQVNGGAAQSFVWAGGLVGLNAGSISNSSASANVMVGSGSGSSLLSDAGGLVGFNFGSITNSSAAGNVSVGAYSNAGGLVGTNFASISNSFGTGNVSSTGVNVSLGGLVGLNATGATISNSNATGAVAATSAGCQTCQFSFAGGLVGTNDGSITSSWANGSVTAGANAEAGGLVGSNAIGASISNSWASGGVTADAGTGFFSFAGGLVGFNDGSVASSWATGNVSVGAGSFAGGLVGFNGDFVATAATISNSFATGNVSSSGLNVSLGGLVGFNATGATITNSRASGNVTDTAAVPVNLSNCTSTSSCAYINVGGLVGQNEGAIIGQTWVTRPTACSAGFTCATGMVTVGSLGTAGGLVGENEGTITNAFVVGTQVVGAAGVASGYAFDNLTRLGGLVGDNNGVIVNTFATGTVGGQVGYLQAGGLVGNNHGSIANSMTSVNVVVGDNSMAGGFVASNGPDNSNTGNNTATITNSFATGNVTTGASSLAGGFAGVSGVGVFDNTHASGTVTAGGNSIVGGFIGILDIGGQISASSASGGLVSSTGPNSFVGGFVGLNAGTVNGSTSTAAVSGGSDSYIGGFAGFNIGTLESVTVDPVVTGTGSNSFIGGIAGLNLGTIDNSTATNLVITSGAGNTVGGVAGVNGTFVLNGSLTVTLGSTFPNGTITNTTATGIGFASAVGSTAPPGSPAPPAWTANCNADICNLINLGSLQTAAPPPPPAPPPAPLPSEVTNYATQQIAQLSVTPPTPTTSDQPVVTPVSLGGNTSGTGNAGSGGQRRSGGNGAPPGTRLIDMAVIPLPPGTGMPPLNEVRFLTNELVFQIANTVSADDVEQIARRFRLTVLSSQPLGMLGRTVYTFRLPDGLSVREVIRQIESSKIAAAVQPNYTYGLAQDQSAPAAPAAVPPASAAPETTAGDPAQYIIEKFHLGDSHRLTMGDNVIVAVIDSEIDAKHPDLNGVVVDRYDAGCEAKEPDAHGTGMTGAIASRRNLLGVAPNVKVIAICAFGGDTTAQATSIKIIKGLDYAISHGARVINMSFAGPRDPALAQALQIAREKGVVLVGAAGNAGPKSPPLYPGADPNVIAVTATDDHDRLFKGANQGKYIAVAAPGVDVLVPAPGEGVQLTTGTSVASAEVTGVVALLLAQKPTRTPEEIRTILMSTAKDLGPKGIDPQFGAGLVDPLKALRLLPPAVSMAPAATTVASAR